MIAQTGFLFSILACRHKVISENHSARYFKLQPWWIKIFYRKFLISNFFFDSGSGFLRRPQNFNQNLPVFLKLIFINFNSKRLEEFCCLRKPELNFTNCLKIVSIEVQPRWYLPLLLPFFVITFFIPNKIYNIFFIFKIMNNGYNSFLISQSKFNIKYFQKKKRQAQFKV